MNKGACDWGVCVVLLGILTVPVALGKIAEMRDAPLDVDAVLADLNAASDGTVALVTMSCFQFHPDVVTVASGQTVYYYWDDLCQIIGHTVTSSGTTTDPAQDLAKPEPPLPGECFDSNSELANPIFGPNNREFSIELQFLLVTIYRDFDTPLDPETLEFNEHSKQCATDASTVFADDPLASYAVVPYHCRQHGANDPAGSGMRGAIVLTF